jgi:hypothetical protein
MRETRREYDDGGDRMDRIGWIGWIGPIDGRYRFDESLLKKLSPSSSSSSFGRTDEDDRSAPRGSVRRAGIAVDDGFGLARKSEP